MGFFAILRDPSDTTAGFEIRECHVDLWALKGLFGRRSFRWDVGLRVNPGPKGFHKFQIALPSGTPNDGMWDLFDELLSDREGKLIFGRPVNVAEGKYIDYGQGKLLLSRIPPTQATVDSAISNSQFTLWNLQTATPVAPGIQTYLRVRFVVNDIGRVWTWKRFILARHAALVDVRLSDLREAWNVKDGDSLEDRIVCVDKLNFFVIAPSSFHSVATSPPVHYVRILEGRAWERYLGRRVNLFGREKLSIFQWRNPAGNPVSVKSPMRVYLDLEKQWGVLSLMNIVAFLIVQAVICGFAVIFAPYAPAKFARAEFAAVTFGELHWKGIGITALLVFIYKLSTRWKMVRQGLELISSVLVRVENWMFRVR